LYEERICLFATKSRGTTDNIIIVINGCSNVSGLSATSVFAEEIDSKDEDKEKNKTKDAGNDNTDKLPSGESIVRNCTGLSRSRRIRY